ncbi:hypothetical protein JTE90_013814 [Oedothorax gibbosus]|uniref:Fatty acyl-CoA reductase n=1 Tax=Oedothorax gibbosus TaxID=931172 RepID=A0AAV6VKA9_9ARAC|nr:hypothetical protein JTE90_013814 [Oedothorax gibbosus]
MDKSYSFSSSELRSLLNRKRKHYTVKSFTRNGQWITHLVLQDKNTGGTAIGKLVERSSEEFRQRPVLHHRNLASLIDMITINDDFDIFVSDFHEKSLRKKVHDEAFIGSPSCFALKKSYIEDVLCGLRYLHRNNLCLLNLSDANVYICETPQQHKAVITDFGSLSEKNSGEGRLLVPSIHQPPELRRMADGGHFDLVAAEMWTMGMMVLEVFTSHSLPWALVDYDPDRVLEMIDKVDYRILKSANSGSAISIHDMWEFKDFVRLFIDTDPAKRTLAKEATLAKFLQSFKNNLSLQKTPQKSPLNLSAGHKTGSTNSLPILKKSVDGNDNSKYYHNDIPDKFKTSENPPGKTSSNMSIKKCVYPLKQNNFSDLKSSYTRPSSYADFENNWHFMNQEKETNSKSKSMFNLDLVKENLKANNNIQLSPKIQSKISVSSQTECPGSVPENSGFERELNTDISPNVCQDKSSNKTNNPFSVNMPFDSYNFSPNATKENPNATEIINETPNDLKRNLSMENKIGTNLPNKCFENLNVLCDTNDYEIFADHLRQATFDELNNCRMMIYQNCRDNSNHNTKDNDQTDSKSTADSKKSVFRIPVSKYRPAEQLMHQNPNFRKLYENLKFETEAVSINQATLPKSGNFGFQDLRSTARNTPDPMSSKDSGINKNEEESSLGEVEQRTFNLRKEVEDLKKNFTEMKIRNNNSFDLKIPSPPTIDAMNLAWRKCSDDVQTNLNENRHGYKCPKFQKTRIRQPNEAIIQNIVKDNRENASEDKCQSCGNRLNEELKVSTKSPEFRQGRPLVQSCALPHEYLFPTTTGRDDTTFPSPSTFVQESDKKTPSGTNNSKKIGCDNNHQESVTPSIQNCNEQVNNDEVKRSKDVASTHCPPPKVIIVRGYTGRNPIMVERVEPKQTRYVKKKVDPKKFTVKKDTCQNGSMECMIVPDSDDEKKSKKKNALVHVSTAYSFCNRRDIEENVYEEKVAPQKVIDIAEWMDESLVEPILPGLMQGRPTTYHYSKALAEVLLKEERGAVPLAIVRPSIVTAAYKEPMPGWVDGVNGPSQFIIMTGKGLLRTMLVYEGSVVDWMPVDLVANLLLTATWHLGTHKPDHIEVYNCTSGDLNRVTWHDVERTAHPLILKYPSINTLRYPGGTFKKHHFLNTLSIRLQHALPAYFVDTLAPLIGQRTEFVPLVRRMERAMGYLQYFTTKEWRFKCDNTVRLREMQAPADRKVFSFDVRPVEWSPYLETYVLGVRKFLLHEEEKTIPAARRRINRLWWCEKIAKTGVVLAIMWLLHAKTNISHHLLWTLIGIVFRIMQHMPKSWIKYINNMQ